MVYQIHLISTDTFHFQSLISSHERVTERSLSTILNVFSLVYLALQFKTKKILTCPSICFFIQESLLCEYFDPFRNWYKGKKLLAKDNRASFRLEKYIVPSRVLYRSDSIRFDHFKVGQFTSPSTKVATWEILGDRSWSVIKH